MTHTMRKVNKLYWLILTGTLSFRNVRLAGEVLINAYFFNVKTYKPKQYKFTFYRTIIYKQYKKKTSGNDHNFHTK